MNDIYRQSLRDTLLTVRKNLSINHQKHISKIICEFCTGLSQWNSAKHIALYMSHLGEIDPFLLAVKGVSQQKTIYYPKVHKGELLFVPLKSETSFVKNHFGILEPELKNDEGTSPNMLDIIFLPLMAFDKKGTRLGFGKGFYDKTLKHSRPKSLIGLAYDFQEQPWIKSESWDVPLDMVITETGVQYC